MLAEIYNQNFIKMKKISLIILTTLFYFNTNAQKIELKKDKILIDNKEVFSYKKSNRNTEFSIFKLNTNVRK